MPASPESTNAFARALVDARGRIVAFAAGCGLAAAGLGLLVPHAYTARVVFLPSEQAKRKPPMEMLALAASVGMSLPTSASGGSDLFPLLLRSDRLLRPMLDESFAGEAGEPVRPLEEWLTDEAGRRPGKERRHEALERLRDDVVRAQRDNESDLVTLQVTTSSPTLSAGIANRLTDELEGYLVGRRREKGHFNRAFLTARREEVDTALAAAEDALADFRDRNRRADSPALQLELERLVRERNLQRTLMVELRKREEMAKLAETRDTPAAKILEHAATPVRDVNPARATMVLLAMTMGLLVPLAGVLVRTAAVKR
jgi:uncharacterized protein involved in exopolysaccharide biosynthesis